MKAIVTSLLAVAIASAALPAAAQFAKAEDAIKYRQSALFIMGQHFGRLGAMVNEKIPFDAKVAADNADIVANMSKLPWAAFGPGTESGAPTKAKPDIWVDQDKFKELSEKLMQETAKLQTAAKTGNADNLKAAFGATAKACKACHDNYRNK